MSHLTSKQRSNPPLPYPWFYFMGYEVKRTAKGIYSSTHCDTFANLDELEREDAFFSSHHLVTTHL